MYLATANSGLTERPAVVLSPPQPVAGSKGGQRAPGARWQDKGAASRARKASEQPAPDHKVERSTDANSNGDRTHNESTRKRRKAHFTLHIDPILKADIHEQARLDKLSASAEGSELLAWALRQKLHQRHAATFESVIEAIITRIIGKRDSRLAYLLVANLLAAEQNRILHATILSLMPGMTDKKLNEILDTSAQRARAKVGRRRPELTAMMRDLEQMLSEEETEEKKKPPKQWRLW